MIFKIRKFIASIFEKITEIIEPDDPNFNSILAHWKNEHYRMTLSFDKQINSKIVVEFYE